MILTGWPTSTTTCKHCGEPIRYFTYRVGNSGEIRPVPRVHNGHCREMAALGLAAKTIKRQERKEAGRSQLELL